MNVNHQILAGCFPFLGKNSAVKSTKYFVIVDNVYMGDITSSLKTKGVVLSTHHSDQSSKT